MFFWTVIRGSVVHVLTDNTIIMYYMNRQGGEYYMIFCQKAIRLWQFCIEENIVVIADYLPRVQNHLTDHLSRNFSMFSEDKCTPGHLCSLGHSNNWLLTMRNKRQCSLLCTQEDLSPRSLSDAFHLSWQSALLYAFPLNPDYPTTHPQAEGRWVQAHSHCPSMADAVLVLWPSHAASSASHTPSSPFWHTLCISQHGCFVTKLRGNAVFASCSTGCTQQ